MTTILFNGEILAVDSRRTCAMEYDDNGAKIITVDGVTYAGEKVIAFAAAGTVPLIAAVFKHFMKGPDDLEKIYQDVSSLGLIDRRHVGPSCSVIFITEKGAYTFRVNTNSSIRITKDMSFPLDFTSDKEKTLILSLGSGGREAAMLWRLFNMPLPLAIAGSELSGRHTGTGGIVHWIRVADGQLAGQGISSWSTVDEIHQAMKKHIASTGCKFNGKERSLINRHVSAVKTKKPSKAAKKAAAKKKAT